MGGSKGIRSAIIGVMQTDPGREASADWIWGQLSSRYTRAQVVQSMHDGCRRKHFDRVSPGVYRLAPALVKDDKTRRRAPAKVGALSFWSSRGRKAREVKVNARLSDGTIAVVGYVLPCWRYGVPGFDYGHEGEGLSGGWWPDVTLAERALLRACGFDLANAGLTEGDAGDPSEAP